MINPLAGTDPAEVLDVRPIGRELAQWLVSDKSAWALPAKFGFIVDGGGALVSWHSNAPMFVLRLWLVRTVAMAIGIETHAGIEWLGSTTPGAAAAAAIEIGSAFIDVRIA